MQLIYLSIQDIHELLQLALHVVLLLPTVVYVHLKTSYPSLQLAVLPLCRLRMKIKDTESIVVLQKIADGWKHFLRGMSEHLM